VTSARIVQKQLGGREAVEAGVVGYVVSRGDPPDPIDHCTWEEQSSAPVISIFVDF